jgi:UDP-glucuronate 4-epimerase
MSKKIIVTGGAGFIGSHLIDKLLAASNDVMCIDNFDAFYNREEKESNIKSHYNYNHYRFVESDIRDGETINKLFSDFQPELIFHLAAKVGVRPSVLDPHTYESVNVTGTLNILEAARKSKPEKLILASSSSVYGLNQKVPFNEADTTLTPASPYAASKIAMEAIAHTYSHLYDLNITALRFFTVYGPRQRPDLAIRKFMKQINKGEPIFLYGDGTTSRDYTFVDDIIQGVLKSMNYSAKKYDVFNLGNSSPVLLIDLIKAIENTVGKKAFIEYKPIQSGDVPVTYADILKSATLLGYKPKTRLEEGLSKMYDWMDKHLYNS